MWMLNRQTRYEVIRKLVSIASNEILTKLIEKTGFKDDSIDSDIEEKRRELIEYLDDMNNTWNDNYVDLTDRQYIRVLKKNDE